MMKGSMKGMKGSHSLDPSVSTETFKKQVAEAHRRFFDQRGINPDEMLRFEFTTKWICPSCERMWHPKSKKECECGYGGGPFRPPSGM